MSVTHRARWVASLAVVLVALTPRLAVAQLPSSGIIHMERFVAGLFSTVSIVPNGTTPPLPSDVIDSQTFVLASDADDDLAQSFFSSSDDDYSGVLAFFKSTGTNAVPLPAVEGNGLGRIDFYARNTSAWRLGSRIEAYTDGPAGTTSIPTVLRFRVLAAGGTAPSWYMRHTGAMDFGIGGVSLTPDGDGALTFKGLGNGSDEDLTWNFDDVANTVGVSSSTGVTGIDFGAIGLTVGSCAGCGAPADATYLTQTPNATLSAEQALSALSTGIMRVATTTGAVTALTDSAGVFANISDETGGTGVLVGSISPSLTTPNIGVATATSVNGLLITGSAGTLTVPTSSSLVRSGAHSLTLTSAGTTVATFPTGTVTLAALSGSNTWSAGNTFSSSFAVGSLSEGTSQALWAGTGIDFSTAADALKAASFTKARNGIGAQAGGILDVDYSFAKFLISATTLTEAASGTHPLIATVAIKPMAVTNAAGATTNAATLYVSGPQTGTAAPTNTYTAWFETGITRVESVTLDTSITGTEIAAPSAPAANGGVIFFQDNGGGKTQACVRFNTGAVQCFATEP